MKFLNEIYQICVKLNFKIVWSKKNKLVIKKLLLWKRYFYNNIKRCYRIKLERKVWGQVNISEGSTITQDFNIMGTSETATLPAG